MLKALFAKVQNSLLGAKAWASNQSRGVKLILAGLLVLGLLGAAKVCLGMSLLPLP